MASQGSKAATVKAEPRVKPEPGPSARVKPEPSARVKPEPSTRVKPEPSARVKPEPSTRPAQHAAPRAPAIPGPRSAITKPARAASSSKRARAPRASKPRATPRQARVAQGTPRASAPRAPAPRAIAPVPLGAAAMDALRQSLTARAVQRAAPPAYRGPASLVYREDYGDGTTFGEGSRFYDRGYGTGYGSRRRGWGGCAFDDDEYGDDYDDDYDDEYGDDYGGGYGGGYGNDDYDEEDEDDEEDGFDEDEDMEDNTPSAAQVPVPKGKINKDTKKKEDTKIKKDTKKEEEVVKQDDEGDNQQPPPLAPREAALQELLNQGIDDTAAQRALDATCNAQNSNDAEQWAEAALIYHTVSLDNEQEIVDLREAMAISHTEAQAAPRPAPQDMTVQELRARYVSSAVLQAVQAVCGEEDVLQGPLRPPLLELLELELKCKQWYPTTATVAYFHAIAKELATDSTTSQEPSTLQHFLTKQVSDLQKLVFEVTDGTVPVAFREVGEQGGDAVNTKTESIARRDGQVVECLVIE